MKICQPFPTIYGLLLVITGIFIFISFTSRFMVFLSPMRSPINKKERDKHQENGTMRCLVIYGTRPELIKLMPVIKEFHSNPSICITDVVSTGQHRQLLEQLEEDFKFKPDENLELMLSGQTLASLFARTVSAMTKLLQKKRPTLIIVQGDTTTAMAAGMSAFQAGIHVIHVEAGLRTGDLSAPYPEEYNRKALALVCTLCFAPTSLAKAALSMEGVKEERIFIVGNTVVDQFLETYKRVPNEVAKAQGVLLTSIATRKDRKRTIKLKMKTDQLLKTNKHIVLVTAHRRENVINGDFIQIGRAIAELAVNFPTVLFIVPLHYNPSVHEILIPFWNDCRNIWLVKPPAYPVFIQLLLRVTIILTDSGGLQEEGILVNLPVLIMRNKTERMESVIAGGAKLVGVNSKTIFDSTSHLLLKTSAYDKMAHAKNPYGNGTSGQQIMAIIHAHRKKLLTYNPQSFLQFQAPNVSLKKDIMLNSSN